MQQADIGLIGLAVMGENLILNMESKGFTVACYNRTVEKVAAFVGGRGRGKNLIGCRSVTELVALRLLFPIIEGGAAAVHSQILATRRPHRRRALSRLTLRSTEPPEAPSTPAQAEFMR